MRLLATVSLVLLLGACGGREVTSTNQARVRNQPPATCTPADFAACPPLAPIACPGDEEAVIDYSADCCAHVSCQVVCTPGTVCPGWPAPTCPPGTTLEILTGTDCCPTYRCVPSATCDPDAAVCPMVAPYCGGIDPIIVGTSVDCCPIYQCPCGPVQPVAGTGGGTPGSTPGGPGGGDPVPGPSPAPDPTYCGCTFPACPPGSQLECYGSGPCGLPCDCVPVTGNCMSDADCGPNMFCDFSMSACNAPCAPETGCIPTPCLGLCVGYVQQGCAADSECPSGQRCELECVGWGCATTVCNCPDNDPTCACPPIAPCVCPDNDPTCTCDANGNCSGQSCFGMCVPATVCTPQRGEPCPDLPPTCVPGPVDPMTCCPTCATPVCNTNPEEACPLIPVCDGAIQIGTDPSCCPIYCCPSDPSCAGTRPL